MNKEIILVTTKGCDSCIKQHIRLNHLYTRYNSKDDLFDYNQIDKSDLDINALKDKQITDFPATIFLVHNEVKDLVIGTMSEQEILDRFKKYNFIG